MNVVDIQSKALPQIKELLRKDPETISSVEKTQDGWTIQCDVLEKKAIPEIFDLMKIFEFRLDNDAKVTGFKQLKRIRRGDIG